MGNKDEQFSEQEIARRRDAVIKLMLNTPPKPHSEMKIGKRKVKEIAEDRSTKKKGRNK
jgi:hypothetical protein